MTREGPGSRLPTGVPGPHFRPLTATVALSMSGCSTDVNRPALQNREPPCVRRQATRPRSSSTPRSTETGRGRAQRGRCGPTAGSAHLETLRREPLRSESRNRQTGQQETGRSRALVAVLDLLQVSHMWEPLRREPLRRESHNRPTGQRGTGVCRLWGRTPGLGCGAFDRRWVWACGGTVVVGRTTVTVGWPADLEVGCPLGAVGHREVGRCARRSGVAITVHTGVEHRAAGCLLRFDGDLTWEFVPVGAAGAGAGYGGVAGTRPGVAPCRQRRPFVAGSPRCSATSSTPAVAQRPRGTPPR